MISEELLHLSINQDTTLLTTGSNSGFKVFRLNPFELINQDDRGNFKIVEMYESTQLLLLVGNGEQPAFSPKRLTVWNIAERTPICETCFPEPILNVKMNRMRIVAVIIDSIYVYNTTTMKTQNIISTVENPKGLVALSPTHTECNLLFPASQTKGQVQVYDCFSMQTKSIINAHNSPLAYISISYQGHICCTASTKGTVIRVFSLHDGFIVCTLKRGISQADIYSLRFSHDCQYLVSTSSTGTIHIFSILSNLNLNENWTDSFKSKFISAASYILPEAYKESLESQRSIISIKTGFNKMFIATLTTDNQFLITVSCSQDYVIYNINLLSSCNFSIQTMGKLSKQILSQKNLEFVSNNN